VSDALPPDAPPPPPPPAAPPSVEPAAEAWHPVRLVVTDDLRRSRLTVFFRLLLAIPHYFWISLIGVVFALLVFVNWFILLFVARTPQGIHDFLAGYIRYTTQLEAYVLLAANPYPPFWPLGEADYPVTLEIDPPAQQSRWKTFFRLFLAIPAFLVSGALLAGGARFGGYGFGLAFTVAFLLWWIGLFLGRSPRALRDLIAFCVGYSAQLAAYLFLVTDRYPYSGPNRFVPPRDDEEPHPVRVDVTDDLRRSRVLTFFRLPISIPHIVWFVLWTIPAAVAAVLNWLCALVTGQAPRPFHRFLSRYVRYSTHLWAFLFLIGNPFPGFTGKPGTYPIEVELPPSESQRRLVTLVRGLLAIPALFILTGLSGALSIVGILGWFVALFLGRMPDGLRNLGAYVLRYGAQTGAYFYVLTERYPDAGPRPDPTSP
jgi:Domain of unknown function (DUF4389)